MKKIDWTSFVIALLLLNFTMNVASCQTAANENPQAPEAIYIPSPFADAHELPTLPEMGKQLENKNAVPEDIDPNTKQIKFQTHFLAVDDATRQAILKLVGNDNLTVTSGKIISDWRPDSSNPSEKELLGNSAVAHKSTLKGHPTRFGQLPSSMLNQIKQIVKASPASNITQAPATITYDNQTGTIMDGALRPFVVGIKPDVTATEVKSVPVIQSIEDGVILRQRANVLSDGMQINLHMISNTVTDVDTYTFSGSASESKTIQLPVCECIQVKCSNRLNSGNVLLIDPNISIETQAAYEKKQFAGLFKQKGITKISRHRMLIVSAEIVD